jgi:hypothetical protein
VIGSECSGGLRCVPVRLACWLIGVLLSMLTKDERKKKNRRDEVKDKRTNDDFF